MSDNFAEIELFNDDVIELEILPSGGQNILDASPDNSQYYSEEAEKSAEKAANSATEAKGYANQTQEIKQSLLSNGDFVAVRNSLDEIATVSDNISVIETNAENIDAIKNVNSNQNKIDVVNNNLTSITTTSSNISNINTVSNNINTIKTVSTNITPISNVNTNIEAVKTNANNITDIKTNASNISDIKNTAKLVTTLDEKVNKSDMVPFEMVEVPTIIETSDPSLMPSWYRVYSDGWCEQGGSISASGNFTINFIKPFLHTPFASKSIQTSYTSSYGEVSSGGAFISITNIGLSGFKDVSDTGDTVWEAKGYIK